MNAVHKELKGEAIYVESRNFNDYSKWKVAFEKAGFAYKKHLNFHANCTDKEQMWERLSNNRKRQIKKKVITSICTVVNFQISLNMWNKEACDSSYFSSYFCYLIIGGRCGSHLYTTSIGT